jgi:hypothetical protein
VPLLARSRAAYLVLGPITIEGPEIEGSKVKGSKLTLDVYFTRLLPKGEYATMNGACCSCCHVDSNCASFVSPCLFGKFPNHGTHVQFFTKELFEIYHYSGSVLGEQIVELLRLPAKDHDTGEVKGTDTTTVPPGHAPEIEGVKRTFRWWSWPFL